MPLEFSNLKVDEIARRLVEPFGLQVVLSSEAKPGKVFTRVACEPETKLLSFISDRAKERGLVIIQYI